MIYSLSSWIHELPKTDQIQEIKGKKLETERNCIDETMISITMSLYSIFETNYVNVIKNARYICKIFFIFYDNHIFII